MEQTPKLAFVEQALAERAQQQQLRSLQPLHPIDAVRVTGYGQILLNFTSNDYLGLSKHPQIIAAAQRYTAQYGTGATASRLVSGTYDIHLHLEEQLAAATGREAALLLNSGFQANATLLPALLDRQSLVLCDRLVHNSLIHGIRASGARFIRYAHNDLNHLESALQQAVQQGVRRMAIVTETVFSMDGDCSDVEALIQLANQYGAILYLDDAHAVGVLGQRGMGLAADRPEVDIVVGTCGKAFGSFGAFVTCSRSLRQYLINFCPGFIYTTALPPAVIGAIEAALLLIPSLDAERLHLAQLSQTLRPELQALGYSTAASRSHIVPLVLGSETRTLHLSDWLKQQGILATAIRPPTVAAGTSRLRFALSSSHTVEHLQYLIQTIASWTDC
ncbi:MAG: 8-amino-7-oxononanoate synthase [Synechococcales cyanobacterium M58_A2018_015]|nr:8-amino-7-oxononanoate synthase [Synechococcales cyanobacterium M58_A2018_015]